MGDLLGRRQIRARQWGLAGVAFVALATFAWLVIRAQTLPTGPQPIQWDHAVCAHCKMHVGSPGSAAQAQRVDGSVLNFDDPGCLIAWLPSQSPPPRAVYFHHHAENRWLESPQVGFLSGGVTPMGSGLRAVETSHPGAVSWEDVLKRGAAKSVQKEAP
ncbi:MAG: hypothetical protein ACKVPX_17170 [Myxococcaceae bacterium]